MGYYESSQYIYDRGCHIGDINNVLLWHSYKTTLCMHLLAFDVTRQILYEKTNTDGVN